MAVLSENDRWELWRDLMREAATLGATFDLTKAELRAAIDAVDANLDGAATTINNWFPQPARNSLGTRQKAFIVGYVAMRRALRS